MDRPLECPWQFPTLMSSRTLIYRNKIYVTKQLVCLMAIRQVQLSGACRLGSVPSRRFNKVSCFKSFVFLRLLDIVFSSFPSSTGLLCPNLCQRIISLLAIHTRNPIILYDTVEKICKKIDKTYDATPPLTTLPGPERDDRDPLLAQ